MKPPAHCQIWEAETHDQDDARAFAAFLLRHGFAFGCANGTRITIPRGIIGEHRLQAMWRRFCDENPIASELDQAIDHARAIEELTG